MLMQGGHAALVGALRREEAASRSIRRLEGELEGVRDVLRQRDMDAQRTKMIIRLKEDKIARLQARLLSSPAAIAKLSAYEKGRVNENHCKPLLWRCALWWCLTEPAFLT